MNPAGADGLKRNLSAAACERAESPTDVAAPDPAEVTELLQWWHSWQIQMLRQEADYIRNNLLQEVFAIRRHLEAASLEMNRQVYPRDALPFDLDHDLAKLTQLYTLLEQLSDRLDSPYGPDALPLALRHAAEPWRQQLPITTDFPQVWARESAIQVRLLIAVVNTLCLTLAASDHPPQAFRLGLTQSAQRKEMRVTVTYCDLPPPALMATVTAELTPMLQTFQRLTQGRYTIEASAEQRSDQQAHQWVCRLCWPLA